MSILIEEKTIKEHTVGVYYDENAESPRKWDNLGTIAYKKGNHYILGDIGLDEEELSKISKDKNYIAFPVYAYIHGGISLSFSPFSCKWDSGQSGIIYALKADIIKEFGGKRIGKKTMQHVINNFKWEIDYFEKYLAGEVFRYETEKNGEIVDFCAGFYDLETCFNCAQVPFDLLTEDKK